MGKRIGIIGAGIGGLATAARLAKSGYRVEVYERLSRCGGRNNLLEDKGFKFDLGPSFVLMPDFFAELFSYCGRALENYLNLTVLDPSYKIFYSDGATLTIYRDKERTKEELEKIEPNSAQAYEEFIQETTRIYSLTKPLLYNCFSKKSLLNPYYWPLLHKIRGMLSYWQLARKFFKSDKLCYAFTFEAMFMGVSPFAAPAFYSVISYADHVQKIYHPLGGMYQIPQGLEKMCGELGVQFHYNVEVDKITPRGSAFILQAGKRGDSLEQVVVNADYAYAQTNLLNRDIPNYKYSCSVLLLYFGLKKRVGGLFHHNLFFSADLRKNLNQIFYEQVMPSDPSFYVHVPTVTDSSLAPQGKDLFYILIPVPNLRKCKEQITQHQERLKRIVLDRLNQTTGIKIEDLIEAEHSFAPQDFITQYNIKYGATFGLAHNLMQSAFFRPANYDAKIKNLYYVGASTQPGGGLPIVIASSRIVADLINNATGSCIRR